MDAKPDHAAGSRLNFPGDITSRASQAANARTPIGQQWIAVSLITGAVEGTWNDRYPRSPGSFAPDVYEHIPVASVPAMGTKYR